MEEDDYDDYEHIIWKVYWYPYGPGKSDGIATGYGLDGPGIESR
jgi:hypothetical protein